MANPIKGEVPFTAEDTEYTLLLDFNALCELEDVLPGLMDGKIELKSAKKIRAVFHAGLQENHPDLDLREAGRLIHVIGLEEAGRLVGDAFAASFPKAKGGEGASRPQSPGAGKRR